jgi:hypothetical protein
MKTSTFNSSQIKAYKSLDGFNIIFEVFSDNIKGGETVKLEFTVTELRNLMYNICGTI